MTPLPSLPLVGGPFDGQRRPIINHEIAETVERLNHGAVEVYALKTTCDGKQWYAYQGSRPLKAKRR